MWWRSRLSVWLHLCSCGVNSGSTQAWNYFYTCFLENVKRKYLKSVFSDPKLYLSRHGAVSFLWRAKFKTTPNQYLVATIWKLVEINFLRKLKILHSGKTVLNVIDWNTLKHSATTLKFEFILLVLEMFSTNFKNELRWWGWEGIAKILDFGLKAQTGSFHMNFCFKKICDMNWEGEVKAYQSWDFTAYSVWPCVSVTDETGGVQLGLFNHQIVGMFVTICGTTMCKYLFLILWKCRTWGFVIHTVPVFYSMMTCLFIIQVQEQ